MEDNWTQNEIIHCPNKECKGMLLSNPYYLSYKCNNCKRNWIPSTYYEEVEENKDNVLTKKGGSKTPKPPSSHKSGGERSQLWKDHDTSRQGVTIRC